ncbi:glycerol-3-phosphate dehydrogenase/oxidase [Nakamurella flava]|uniref:Glycerol-3-phosphate dehydrogenase/oxidase n=1 Tax=Nakamurella flava TaxID=2576308 RepID=A0A4U6QJ12_9ACTN|nr:glycerol-3-phosphate dehydrogenase/oxidase [Nakamurella flava]TKV60393.1 glycerol-3-phosphate dehydrogenase/oxidase [Nakamurella flava]
MDVLDRPSVEQLQGAHFDVAVIGAGINGAAVARDAATRGLSVLVVDKADIGSGTSSWSSRLIHGGLRYLEHGELRLVYESLHDREKLLHIAPHLVTPLPFVVPLYKHNHKPGWMFRIGMYLYDTLSLRKSVPRHRRLDRKAIKVELGSLNPEGLSGGLRYYDGQVVFAERLVLETLISAVEAGARFLTYAEASVAVSGGRVTGLKVHDQLTGQQFDVHASVVVNAAGPWVDEAGAGLQLDRMIGGTKGTHLVVDPFPGAPDVALYYEARSDNRPILVIPWNGRYLIGTTDDRFEGDLDATRGTDDEMDYLLTETNTLIPEAGLTRDSVLFTYAGVRPLPYRPGVKSGNIPRSHLILDHESIGGLISIVGGKLTPHLSLGTETVDKVAAVLGRKLPASRTAETALPGGASDWPAAARALRRELAGHDYTAAVVDRLLDVYGTRVRVLLDLVKSDPAQGALIGSGDSALLTAEVTLAVKAEGAVHVADILHRRSMVGLLPTLGLDVDQAVAEVAAPLLGWSAEQVGSEVAAHREYVRLRLLGGVDRAVLDEAGQPVATS